MISRSFVLVGSVVAIASLASGCFFGGEQSAPFTTGTGNASGSGGSGGTGVETGGGPSSTDKDLAQYDATQASLASKLTMFSAQGLSSMTSAGSRLFWLEFATDSPTVSSFDTASNTKVDYTFMIGGPCDYNFRASESLVVWADTNGGYYAYDVTKPASSVGTLMVAPPSEDVQWWAYAPDQGNVYYVVTGSDTELWKWVPPATTPTMLFTLESAGATGLGEFEDFGVSGNTMVFLAGGAVWSVDIAAQKATPLGNTIEDETGAEIDPDGVLFPTDTGAYFYSNATMKLRDLAAAIEASKYQLNATFSMAHYYDASRGGLYTASSGIFSFALDTGTVAPVLLDARDLSTYWTQLTVLTNGNMFIQGLQSSDGAIGADGPIYRLNLAQ
jgi:hypothetical protein